MRVSVVVFAVVVVALGAGSLLGCSYRPVPSGRPGSTGDGAIGGAGTGTDAGDGGAGGATTAGSAGRGETSALCLGRDGAPAVLPALLGRDGNRIVFVLDDGSTRGADDPATTYTVLQKNGWEATYGFPTEATWRAQLFDSSGRLRYDRTGDLGVPLPGAKAGFSGASLLSDGTLVMNMAHSDDNVVLSPDGGVLRRPSFATEPDARGWVGATLASSTQGLGVPVFLNVPTGEVRTLTYLAAGDGWAPIVDGARRLYLAEMNGGVALVDESVDAIHVETLTGWPRAALEVDTTPLSTGAVAAYVGLWDDNHRGVPLWLYDVGTQTLATALPEAAAVDGATGYSSGDEIDVNAPGVPAWRIELTTGAILDLRAGVAARPTRPLPGGAHDWILQADAQKNVYRYDRNNGTVEDLHVAGDPTLVGRRAVVVRDGLPRAWIDLDGGQTTDIAGAGDLVVPSQVAQGNGRFVAGFARPVTGGFGPLAPVWRVDLDAAVASAFPGIESPLRVVAGLGGPIFSGSVPPLLADGTAGLILSDGFGAGLYVGGPGVPWRLVGHEVRQVESVGWAVGDGFAIASEQDCDCYDPIELSWTAPPGAPETLAGVSLQFVAPDGSDLFPPRLGEHLAGFADDGHTCALAGTDAGDWAVYDLAGRTRHALGHFDALSWIDRGAF